MVINWSVTRTELARHQQAFGRVLPVPRMARTAMVTQVAPSDGVRTAGSTSVPPTTKPPSRSAGWTASSPSAAMASGRSCSRPKASSPRIQTRLTQSRTGARDSSGTARISSADSVRSDVPVNVSTTIGSVARPPSSMSPSSAVIVTRCAPPLIEKRPTNLLTSASSRWTTTSTLAPGGTTTGSTSTRLRTPNSSDASWAAMEQSVVPSSTCCPWTTCAAKYGSS